MWNAWNAGQIAALVITSVFGMPQAGKPVFSLSLNAPIQPVKAGSQVIVTVTLMNVTDREIRFFDANPDCDYVAEVKNDQNLPAAQTSYNLNLKCSERPGDARNILRILKPHESKREEIDLSKLYVLERAGKYMAQVSRRTPKQLDGSLVRSNVVTVTVLED